MHSRKLRRVLQWILPATVPWFTSNRFARKSNYPRGEHAEKPRIKKHWDLRKISTRYKSKPPRNLLFLVPIPHSLLTMAIDNRRGSSREINANVNLEIVHFSGNRRNDFKCLLLAILWLRNASPIAIDEHVNRRPSMQLSRSVSVLEAIDTWISTEILCPGKEEHLDS